MGSAPGALPPMTQNVLNFMQFFGKFGKIVCYHPLAGQRPLLCGILDLPPGADPKGARNAHSWSNFFHFHADFAKIKKNWLQRLENPGSATGIQ